MTRPLFSIYLPDGRCYDVTAGRAYQVTAIEGAHIPPFVEKPIAILSKGDRAEFLEVLNICKDITERIQEKDKTL